MDCDAAPVVILIVDDTAAIVTLLTDVLTTVPGYYPVAVTDGAQARRVLPELAAQLILLDLELPGLDGLEVYDWLQADPVLHATPVLFLTAHPDLPAFAARQFPHVLAKPFDRDVLLRQIAELLHADTGVA